MRLMRLGAVRAIVLAGVMAAAAPIARAQTTSADTSALAGSLQRDLLRLRDLARQAKKDIGRENAGAGALASALAAVSADDLLLSTHYRNLEQQLRDAGAPAVVIDRQRAMAGSYAKTLDRVRAAIDAIAAAAQSDVAPPADALAALVQAIESLPAPAADRAPLAATLPLRSLRLPI